MISLFCNFAALSEIPMTQLGEVTSLQILIHKYFLAIMNFLIDIKTVDKAVVDEESLAQSLKCMNVLLQQINKTGVDEYVPKIMATLKFCIEQVWKYYTHFSIFFHFVSFQESLASAACDVWKTFIFMLSDTNLITNLYSIFVSLTSCLDSNVKETDDCPVSSEAHNKACELLTFLIIEKRWVLKDRLKEL
jgi:hypothetical protein